MNGVPFFNLEQEPTSFDPNQIQSFDITADQDVIFSGRQFLKEYLNDITPEGLSKLLDELNRIYPNKFPKDKYDEIFAAIQNLEFEFHDEGDAVKKGQPLLTVTGNPLAIELIKTELSSIVGFMTGVATHAHELVEASKQEGYKTPLFAYLGLRRSAPPGYPTLADYAAVHGGFGSCANIAAKIKGPYHLDENLLVIGTIAHAFISTMSAAWEMAKKDSGARNDDTLNEFLAVCGITSDQYTNVIYGSGKYEKIDPEICDLNTCDHNDYVAFSAYINAIKDLERQDGGKPKGVVLLVDTTDTIAGVKAAIRAAIDHGRKITGVRLDTSPDKYLAEAWELIKEAQRAYPELFGEIRIYMTDGIEKSVIEKIKKIQKDNNITAQLVYGIGSAIANTKPTKLNFKESEAFKLEGKPTEISGYKPDEKRPHVIDGRKFCLAKGGSKPRAKATQKEYVRGKMVADFYSLTQSQIFQWLNDKFRATKKVAPITQMSSQLNFRHRDNVPNHLYVAGVKQAVTLLENFEFNQEFVDSLKACGLSLREDQFEALLTKKKLNVKVSTMVEGSIAKPYETILNISGDPSDVLLVESMILSIVGSMSAVATAAREMFDGLRFSYDEMFNNDKVLINACKLYSLDKEAAKNKEMMSFIRDIKEGKKQPPMNPIGRHALVKFLNDHYSPAFSYSGLSAERTLSSQRAYAAFVAGFNGTTMYNELGIPLSRIGTTHEEYTKNPTTAVMPILFDVNEDNYSKVLKVVAKLSKDKSITFQLRGDFTADILQELRDVCADHNIEFNRLEILVREPIASAENLKGVVYKAGALGFEKSKDHTDVVLCMKIAGAKGKPGVKSSVLGNTQVTALLRDADGLAIGKIVFDKDLLPKDKRSDKDISDFILEQVKNGNVVIYYSTEVSDSKEKAVFGKTQEVFKKIPASVEILMTQTIDISKSKGANPDVAAEMRASRAQAQRAAREQWHTFPVFMVKQLYGAALDLIKRSSNAETLKPESLKLRKM